MHWKADWCRLAAKTCFIRNLRKNNVLQVQKGAMQCARKRLSCQAGLDVCGAGKILASLWRFWAGHGKQEFVVCAASAAQSEPAETKDAFEVGKRHPDLLPKLHRDVLWAGFRDVAGDQPTKRRAGTVGRVSDQPFRPDTEATPDQKHADQQYGIDRRTACMAVGLRQPGADTAQIDEAIKPEIFNEKSPERTFKNQIVLTAEIARATATYDLGPSRSPSR